jgi:hypothetical protein
MKTPITPAARTLFAKKGLGENETMGTALVRGIA